MFEVRNIRTNEIWAARTSMGAAMDSADAFRLGTGDDFCVVELKAVYHTADANYCLRPTPAVLSRAVGSLMEGWERFRSLRAKVHKVTPHG